MPSWTVYKRQEEERKRFGWDDLFDLLNTAAGVYTGVKGIQEAGKRTALAQEQQDLATQSAGMDVLSEGREGVWNKLAEQFAGPPTAEQIGEVGGPLGRQQFTEAPPQEWPEVPGQTHVGGGEYERNYPQDEPFIGAPPPAVDVPGQVPVNWTRDEGWEYKRGYPPDVPGITVEGVPGELTTSTLGAHQQDIMGLREPDFGVAGSKMMAGGISPLFGYEGSSGEYLREAIITETAQRGLGKLQAQAPALYAEVMQSTPEEIQVAADEYAKDPEHDAEILAGLLAWVRLFGMGSQ